ncbi:hypothetical protein [Actinomadura algeriensis]|uniref:Uncharacterized protein n=1 Tax=Actinomadura algeriensis TaxID=1679523 RepID=A0ABR9JMV1_9ACTN|nr:hypothetical protein [Actinomadura algeriensis]MBE1531894.1 hypothetical protein [Actinomadura algeriensis]
MINSLASDNTSAALAADFPGWAIWQSDGGHWYATRRARLAERMHRYRLWTTLDAADLTELRNELATQTARAELPLALFGTLS